MVHMVQACEKGREGGRERGEVREGGACVPASMHLYKNTST